MRSILMLSCVVAAAAGCETTRPSTVNCVPCKTLKPSCAVAPGASSPAANPTKPAVLPPTIKEVRSEDPEPRQFASTASVAVPAATPSAVQPPVANQGDVLLIPRWVYVPYSPHTPNGQTKLPSNMTPASGTNPYVQIENAMTVLPPMGVNPTATAAASQTAVMEQCLQQMKMLNQRMSDLEAKNVARPATIATPTVIPVASPSMPQMLPLPPPLAAPMIPPAK